MKRTLTVLITAALVLSFAGCRKKEPEQSLAETAVTTEVVTEEETTVETTVENESETETAEEKTPEYLDRSNSKDIICFAGGKEGKYPSDLFIGDAYSIYIMNENWEHSKETTDGFNTDIWRNTKNKKDVLLKVLALKNKEMPEALEYIKTVYSDYELYEDKQGGLGGMNKQEQILNAAFYKSDDIVYAVITTYPVSESETNGIKLSAMADTFKK